MNGTKIKLCGLFRQEDAQAVNAAQPDYAGFVFYAKSKRNVSPALAAVLRAAIRPEIVTVGVFVDAPVEQIVNLARSGVISIAQLHGNEDIAYLEALRARAPELVIWQAFQVQTAETVALAAASSADMILLDGGAGDGEIFSWPLVKNCPFPFILAGGLTPENIPEAIQTLRPFAVDVSTGVETNGVKDETKMIAAVQAARRIHHA